MLKKILAGEPVLSIIVWLLVVALIVMGAFVPAFILSVIAEIGAILILTEGPESHRKVKPFNLRFLPGSAVALNVVLGLLLCVLLAMTLWGT